MKLILIIYLFILGCNNSVPPQKVCGESNNTSEIVYAIKQLPEIDYIIVQGILPVDCTQCIYYSEKMKDSMGWYTFQIALPCGKYSVNDTIWIENGGEKK